MDSITGRALILKKPDPEKNLQNHCWTMILDPQNIGGTRLKVEILEFAEQKP